MYIRMHSCIHVYLSFRFRRRWRRTRRIDDDSFFRFSFFVCRRLHAVLFVYLCMCPMRIRAMQIRLRSRHIRTVHYRSCFYVIIRRRNDDKFRSRRRKACLSSSCVLACTVRLFLCIYSKLWVFVLVYFWLTLFNHNTLTPLHTRIHTVHIHYTTLRYQTLLCCCVLVIPMLCCCLVHWHVQ